MSITSWRNAGKSESATLVPGRPQPSASLVRQVNNEVARVQGGGLVQNARLGTLDFVGGTAQRLIETQQQNADAVGQRTPRAEAGCQTIADIITAAAARIVSETAQ